MYSGFLGFCWQGFEGVFSGLWGGGMSVFLTQRFAKVNAEVRKEDLRWGGEVLIFNMPFVGLGKYKYCVKNSTDILK